MWKSTMFTVQFWLLLWKNVTEEKILAPYDIFEGLSNVHDQVPYEDHSSSHSTINVPKPEAGNKTIIALEKQIRKKYDNNCTDYRPEEKCIESFVPQLTSNPEECVPKYVVDLWVDVKQFLVFQSHVALVFF